MISVCIATYNGEKYIKQQLESILFQLSHSDEVVISDDASTDKTLEIIASLNDKRIKIYLNNINRGYVYNFENAIKHAKGDIIFLSDQDDVWLNNRVSAVLPLLQEDNLVICNGYFTDENLNKTSTISDFREYKKGFFNNLYKNIFWGVTFAFTKNIKDYCLPIPKYVKGHDCWIGLICELNFKVIYFDKPLVLYRRHEGAISHKLPFIKQLQSRTIFFFCTIKRVLQKKYNSQK